MFIYLCATVVFLCLIHILFNYNERARLVKKIPGPKDKFLVGNALELLISPVELFSLGRKYAKKYNGIYRVWAYPICAINIYNPDDIEIITSTMKHSEKSPVYKFLSPWLRSGLLLSNGPKWQHRRKILTPAFHFNILRQFCVTFQDNNSLLVKYLDDHIEEPIDVAQVLSEITLNSICETAMGSKLSECTASNAKSYKEAIFEMGKLLVWRFSRPMFYVDFIFNLTSVRKRQDKFLKTAHEFTGNVIKNRKKYVEENGINFSADNEDNLYIGHKKRKFALLDLLISAEKNDLIDNVGIQEEVDTFMFEGHDTTASGLTFCLMLLANHKDIQDKVVLEINSIFTDITSPANIEDLSRMRYLECCIKESLRLYPPVHFISRKITETTQLSNYTIPAGSDCHIHIYDLHRREDLFNNALTFDPDRFLPENSIGRHPYAYIPFSAGPRNCIGQKFAMLEMKSVICAVLREFELVPVTRSEDMVFASDLVLRNTAPVYVKFLKRTRD